jgi:hypothetical protein
MIKNNSSYKYPIFFLALIALISFSEISKSDERADECAASIPTDNITWQWCSTQPTTQIITIYKVAFCTALPTIPTSTTATGMTNCSTVFENTAGAPVSIVKGIGATPNGTFSAPPVGNYTYAYVELSNVFIYKANLVFSSTTPQSSDDIAGGQGPNCHTNGTNVYYLGEIRGITCTGNEVGIATNTNANVNSFDDTTAEFSEIGTEGTVANIHVYLIQSNGNLATGTALAIKGNNGNVAKLIALIPITVTVTSDTKSYNLLYNNTLGMDVLQLKTLGSINVGLSAAYFDMIFQVQ